MSRHTDLLLQLKEALKELGTAAGSGLVQNALEKELQKKTDADQCVADIYCSEAVWTNAQHPLWQQLEKPEGITSICPGYTLHWYCIKKLPVLRLGNVLPGMAIVIWDGNLQNDVPTLLCLKRKYTQYNALVVLCYESCDPGSFREIKSGFYGVYHFIEMKEKESTNFQDVLNEYLDRETKRKLQERTEYNALMPYVQLIRDMVNEENRLTAAQKAVNTQSNTALRKNEVQSNTGDVVNQLRTQLQYWISDTEKNIRLKYEELNKPNTGSYSRHIQLWVGELTDLERTKMAEKTEKLAASVSQDFLKKFEQNVKRTAENDFANDYNIMLSSAENELAAANDMLRKKGISQKDNNALQLDLSRFPDAEKTLKSYISYTRLYAGELVKKGASEYFVALREYSGQIMIVTGLLAPLYMIAGLSSNEATQNTWYSFLSNLPWLKNMSTFVRITTGFLALAMIIYGFFDLRKRIPKKRAEEFDRELRKAKDTLSAEGRRMFADASKDWQSNLNQWLRETGGQLTSQLDKNTREHNNLLQSQLNEEKIRVQKSSQGIENTARRVNNAEKTVDNVYRSYRDGIADIEKSLRK